MTIGDKTYISSKRAAEITGYAKDYIGQLCREGRVNARLVGRNWYVLEESLRSHRFGEEPKKRAEEQENKIQEDGVVAPTWEVSRYEAEEPVRIPELEDTSHTDSPDISTKETRQPGDQSIVADMQTAWKDWFLKRGHEQEEVVETPVMTEVMQDQGEKPALGEVVSAEESEKPVSVHIERISMEEKRPEEVSLPREEKPRVFDEILKEKRMSLETKNWLRRVIVVISTVMALSSLSVALLGSGIFDSYVASPVPGLEFIRYLSGVSVKQAM